MLLRSPVCRVPLMVRRVHWHPRDPPVQSCDLAYGPSASTYQPSTAAGIGYTPTLNVWHHVVVTYPGGSNGNETLYVDGVAQSAANHSLNINRPPNMVLGAWFTSPVYYGGEVAVGALRMHDGMLSAADVAYNYAVDYLWYHATPSSTPTPSLTASSTSTASTTASATSSPSPTASQSATPSNTPSVTPSPSQTVVASLSAIRWL